MFASTAAPAALILLLWRAPEATALSIAAAILLVVLIEAIANHSLRAPFAFLLSSPREAAITILALAAPGLLLDAIFGREVLGWTIIASPLLVLAWINFEKEQHLLEPLYPSDFLFVRQVLDLLPSLARARTGVLMVGVAIAVAAAAASLFLAQQAGAELSRDCRRREATFRTWRLRARWRPRSTPRAAPHSCSR